MKWEDSKEIPWGFLLLFGGGLAITAGFTATGLSGWIGEQLQVLEGMNFIIIVLVSTAVSLSLRRPDPVVLYSVAIVQTGRLMLGMG
ncbi:SLC13 family permease [Virgibacillus sp. CBA3643]|uniref:SLC13 family permease n=1 Tax=Virgibacillus sp. CBA3643 TaxID=2942278 RepID=UPI0035A34142